MIFLILNNFYFPREFILYRENGKKYIYAEIFDEISMQQFINQ